MRAGGSAAGGPTVSEKACNVGVGNIKVRTQSFEEFLIREVELVGRGLRVPLAAEVAPVNVLEVVCGTDMVGNDCLEICDPRLKAFVFSSLGGGISVRLRHLCSCGGYKACVVLFQPLDL